MKKIISLIFLLTVFVICTSFPAIAAEQDANTYNTGQSLHVVSQSVSCSVQGNIITVKNADACKLGYWNDATKSYVEIPCVANCNGSYSFIVPEGITELLLVVTGDVDGNGVLEEVDNSLLGKGLLPKDFTDYVELTAIQHFAADVNGNGRVNSADRTLIARSLLHHDHLAHKPLSWKPTEGEPQEHSWDAGTVTKEATEEAEGEMHFTCTACSATKTEPIPVLEHVHRYETVVVTDPTCTAVGYTTYTCRCGDSYTANETAVLGHSWQEASCLAPMTCKTCGATSGGLAEHKYNSVITEPTYEEEGYTTHSCSICTYSYQDNFTEKLGQQYEEGTLAFCVDGVARLYGVNNQVVKKYTGWDSGSYNSQTATPWYGDMGEFTKVVIEDGISPSTNYWFYGCIDLTCVVIGNGVTRIGSNTFRECTGLTSITIPDSVTSINYSAFQDCTGLTSVIIGNGVNSIGTNAFQGCTKLLNITIPDKVTRIANCTFQGCTKLKSVTLPVGVTNIGFGAFYGCSSLTSITIPESVISIGGSAFLNCSSLTSIVIPDSVISIGEYAFYKCSSLTTITIPFVGATASGAANWHFGYIFGADDYTSNEYRVPESLRTVVITGGRSIGSYAFYECKGLASITIPDSVTSIGEEAFYFCRNLTSITISDSVTSIGSHAFYFCFNLATVTIGSNSKLTNIGDHVFGGCKALTEVIIPNSVIIIDNCAFFGCSSLTSITIPDSVTSIGSAAFYGCSSLTSIVIPDSVTSIGSIVFMSCTGLTSVTIPDSVTSIDPTAFRDCTSLVNIDVHSDNSTYCSADGVLYTKDMYSIVCYPVGKTNTSFVIRGSVTAIGNSAFYGCTGLTSITIPNSVTTIGKYAFYNCTSITNVEIPSSVTSIGDDAFGGCTKLTSIIIPSSVTSIGKSIFYGCTSLSSIVVDLNNGSYCSIDGVLFTKNMDTLICYPSAKAGTSFVIPSSVTSLSSFAFQNCSKLTTVSFGENSQITTIGNYTFDGCSSLKSITFSENSQLTSIGDDAFGGCTKLTNIIIPSSVTSIGANAFYGCTSLTSIVIPDSVTSIGSFTFYGCTGLTSITISSSVTNIGTYAFYNCKALSSITFEGTVEQWNAITKDTNWNKNVPATEVICSNGKVTL